MNNRLPHIIALFLLIISASVSRAGHVGVMEMTYRWVADSTYEITMLFYSNCTGAAPPSVANLRISSASTSQNFTQSFNRLPVSGPGIPPATVPNLFNCQPANPTLCYNEYIYRDQVTLTGKARDWIFSYDLCCATPIFSNVMSSSQYVSCGLNNLDFPDQVSQNWSPIWHNRRPNLPGFLNDTLINFPVLSVCAGSTVLMDQAAKEYQGDIVRYEVTDPQTTGGSAMPYLAPYTPSYQMDLDTPPAFFVDSIQGTLFFKPIDKPSSAAQANFYLAAMKATEYRMDSVWNGSSWVLERKQIGWTIRNFFIAVTASAHCPDTTISFSDPMNPSASASRIQLDCGDTTFRFSLNTPIQCKSVDVNASFATLIDSTTNLPVSLVSAKAINCDSRDNTQLIELETNVPLSSGQVYKLTFKTGNDGNTLLGECGSELDQYKDTLTLEVTAVATGEIKGDQVSGSQFSDTLIAGCNQPTLIVNLTEKAACNSIEPGGSDFMLQNTQAPFNIHAISAAATVNCTGDETSAIELTLVSPLQPGTYNLRSISGNDGNIFLNKCDDPWVTNTIVVTADEVAVNLGSDTTYCKGTAFSTTLNAGAGFAHYQWNTGAGDTTQQLVVTTEGVYYVNVQSEFGCSSTDTIVITEIDCGGVGIHGNTLSNLNIFPNPAIDELFITTGSNGDLQVTIMDITGKVRFAQRYRQSSSTVQIPLDELSNGIYFVQVQSGSDTAVRKVTIQR